MDTRIETDGASVTVSEYDDGIWISVNRHCAYTSAGLTRAQAIKLRDGINTLLETADATQ
jgi:hypothetical protein